MGAVTSKTLVNGHSNKVVNIPSTKMMKKIFAGAIFSMSFRGASKTRTRNLEIPRCAIAHLGSGPSDNPGMTRTSAKRNSRLAGDRLAERGLRGGQPRDRDAVGRARDVIEANLVAERDGGGIAAMLSTDPDLDIRAGLAAAHDADLHQLANAVAIDRDERIDLQNPLCDVGAEESGGVISADAVGGLRQVVGAERKELSGRCDLASHQAGA